MCKLKRFNVQLSWLRCGRCTCTFRKLSKAATTKAPIKSYKRYYKIAIILFPSHLIRIMWLYDLEAEFITAMLKSRKRHKNWTSCFHFLRPRLGTLTRFRLKTQLFLYELAFRPHVSGEGGSLGVFQRNVELILFAFHL